MGQISPDHSTYPPGDTQYHPNPKQWEYQEDWGNEGSSGDILGKSLEWQKEGMRDLSWADRITQKGKDKDKGGIMKGQRKGEKNWYQDHFHNHEEAEDLSRDAERIKDKRRIQQLEMLLELPGSTQTDQTWHNPQEIPPVQPVPIGTNTHISRGWGEQAQTGENTWSTSNNPYKPEDQKGGRNNHVCWQIRSSAKLVNRKS